MAGQLLIQRGAVGAGGGSGTPGGSDTQVQYNDGGAFGGDAGLVFNETTDLLTADHVLLAQGTITDPENNLEGTVTWNDAADTFTAWKLNVTNTASAAASLLLDLQVGSASKLQVRKDGRLTLPGAADVSLMNSSANLLIDVTDGQMIALRHNSTITVTLGGGAAGVGQNITFGAGLDATLCRDAADILAQRRDTFAQTYRVYGTWTNSTNYERLSLSATAATKVTLAAETAGTGTDNLDVELLPAGTGVVQISNPQDGAGAQAATITNGPTAGNPAIWLKVKIGANVRYIPAWA